MAIIDVKVIEPDGTTWNAQLDNSESVEDIVLSLLPQLDLPTDISYQLIRKATGQALHGDKTLATLGIKAGEILLIKPFQNKAFMRIKKALYEKAEDYVVEESWELAKEQLDKLFRLEPDHPDREELRQKIEANIRVASQSVAQAAASGAWGWVALIFIMAIVVVQPWKLWEASKDSGGQTQTKGSFTAKMIPSGHSYYFTVTGRQGDRIQVVVQGTDGWRGTVRGNGTLRTNKIPRAEPGTIDTIRVKSLDTGEVQTFTFKF